MNKKEFLYDLRSALEEFKISQISIAEILDDHAMIIDEAVENGLEESDITSRLGEPRHIAKKMRKTEFVGDMKENRFVAVSPFIALVAFFLLGFYQELWHPGWLFFLMIPMSAVIFSKHIKKAEMCVSLAPFVATIAFVLIGYFTEVYHPTWVVFTIIPVLALFQHPTKLKIAVIFVAMLLLALYVWLTLNRPSTLNLLVLVALLMPLYLSGAITVTINHKRQPYIEKRALILFMVISIIVILIAHFLGIVAYAMLLYLLVPCYMTLKMSKNLEEKVPAILYVIVCAIISLVVVGELFDAYGVSWLFVLLIPIAGILMPSNKKTTPSSIQVDIRGDLYQKKEDIEE